MNPLNLIKLNPLMNISRGSPDVVIGIIDGPVDFAHPAFKDLHMRTAKESQLGVCKLADSLACKHGTFITGILSAKRESPAPAICPQCKILLRPIFSESNSKNGNLPTSTPEELASAIFEMIDAGARIINLSLGLSESSSNISPNLKEAYDYTQRRGVIVVAASGNQDKIGRIPLVDHSWIIPVVACDEQGKLSPGSNIGPSIGQRGVMAPGMNITSTSPGGQFIKLSGTSVAAPFVTGTIALLWSELTGVSAQEIRYSIIAATGQHRRTIIPPLLNAEKAWEKLKSIHYYSNNQRRRITMVNENKPEELNQPNEEEVNSTVEQQVNSQIQESQPQREQVFVSQDQRVMSEQVDKRESCPPYSGNNLTEFKSPEFVYVWGRVETPIFPTMSIEKEFAQVAAQEDDTSNLTDTELIYNVLKENRYLALEVCWPFTVEGVEAYLLMPRGPFDVDNLIEAIKPTENRQLYYDIVIGVKGPIAPMEMCNGLMVPTLIIKNIYSFDLPTLIKAIPKPKDIEAKTFHKASEEVISRILKIADNVGTGDNISLNYLLARDKDIFQLTADMYAKEYSLTRVETRHSDLGVGRIINSVILVFEHRKTGFVEKFATKVDRTGPFPFKVTGWGAFVEK